MALRVLCLAFNLFDGTSYFFFSGVSNFGDWAAVISGLPSHGLWRWFLILAGMAMYYAAVLIIGSALVRYLGIPREDTRRLNALTLIPYFSAVILACAGAVPNPIGIRLMWLSALPATAGAHSGLLWLRHYIPRSAAPQRPSAPIMCSYPWLATAAILSLAFIFILGRGITLHR